MAFSPSKALLGSLSPSSSLLPLLFLLYIVYAVQSLYRTYQTRKRMPPGPRGVPFLGNTHQIPAKKPWRKFEALNKQYGDVVSLFLGRTPVIVLGTAQAAWDLLEKRSEIYSSRPRSIMGGEILSRNMRGLLAPYGDQWRRWRKVQHSGFHSRKSSEYKEIQSLESKQTLVQLVEDPDNYERHFQRYAASVATSATYGRRVENPDEWIVKENLAVVEYLISIVIPGKYLVETWPWLLKLPRPLQWFRHEPERQRIKEIALYTHLLTDVKQRLAQGTIPDCLTVQTLNAQEKSGMSDLEIAYAVSSPFGAGIDTTASTMCTFILAMLHNPNVMKKAQAELDGVVGMDRMPDFDDADRLPYIKALMNETLRWRPVAALGGQPHAVTQDDEYNGMFIPKGSTIIANLSGIMNDPDLFPNPDQFDPDRFIDTTNPRLLTFDLPFGFGRRSCPGMHLALNSLFINVSRLLWGFDILPLEGVELPDTGDAGYTDGFNTRPKSFKCCIVPRDQKVLDVIEREWADAKERLGKWA